MTFILCTFRGRLPSFLALDETGTTNTSWTSSIGSFGVASCFGEHCQLFFFSLWIFQEVVHHKNVKENMFTCDLLLEKFTKRRTNSTRILEAAVCGPTRIAWSQILLVEIIISFHLQPAQTSSATSRPLLHKLTFAPSGVQCVHLITHAFALGAGVVCVARACHACFYINSAVNKHCNLLTYLHTRHVDLELLTAAKNKWPHQNCWYSSASVSIL